MTRRKTRAAAAILFLIGSPAAAATVVDLGPLGSAFGTVAYPQPATYAPSDLQTTRFLFSVPSAGSLAVQLIYDNEIRALVEEVCSDPADPSSCMLQPTGGGDYAGVRLQSFTLGQVGSAGTTTALPDGFFSLIDGGPGAGIPTFGFAYVQWQYYLGSDFHLGTGGNYFADVSGYGLIRAPDFPGTGGGTVSYYFAFSPAAVPEPSIWALMITGVGAIGYTMRRQRKPAPAAG